MARHDGNSFIEKARHASLRQTCTRRQEKFVLTANQHASKYTVQAADNAPKNLPAAMTEERSQSIVGTPPPGAAKPAAGAPAQMLAPAPTPAATKAKAKPKPKLKQTEAAAPATSAREAGAPAGAQAPISISPPF